SPGYQSTRQYGLGLRQWEALLGVTMLGPTGHASGTHHRQVVLVRRQQRVGWRWPWWAELARLDRQELLRSVGNWVESLATRLRCSLLHRVRESIEIITARAAFADSLVY